jgi:hypothetical protein
MPGQKPMKPPGGMGRPGMPGMGAMGQELAIQEASLNSLIGLLPEGAQGLYQASLASILNGSAADKLASMANLEQSLYQAIAHYSKRQAEQPQEEPSALDFADDLPDGSAEGSAKSGPTAKGMPPSGKPAARPGNGQATPQHFNGNAAFAAGRALPPGGGFGAGLSIKA